MGKRASHEGLTDASTDNPDPTATRAIDRAPERTTGYSLAGSCRRASPAHRKPGDIIFSGIDPSTGEFRTTFTPTTEAH